LYRKLLEKCRCWQCRFGCVCRTRRTDGFYKNTDGKTRDVIILACYSKRFFEPHLQHAKVNPLVWTSGLMAAEAYTLHDALTGYVNGESDEQIRLRAAKAYAKHQKCNEKAARNLFRK